MDGSVRFTSTMPSRTSTRVDAEPAGRPVGVVTSDQEVARDVVGKAGVRVVGSRALVRLLG